MKKWINNKLFVYCAAVLLGLGATVLIKSNNIEHEDTQTLTPSKKNAPFKRETDEINIINRRISGLKTTKAPEPQTIIKEVYKSATSPTLPEAAPQEKSKNKLNDFSLIKNQEIHFAIDHYSSPQKKPEAQTPSVTPKNDTPPPPVNAPFGRMVKCELVNTLESGNQQTPIIALVTEDVCWNQQVILPAMTEIHGKIAAITLRNRISSQENWTAILPQTPELPNGTTVKLKGWALDRDDKDGQGQTFGLCDGSYGIKGTRVQSEQLEELKLFAATFIGAATAGLQNQEPTGTLLGGTKVKNTARDAALGGLSSVMEMQADRIFNDLKENGFYTQVPAGKQFYLYIEEITKN